MKKTKVAFLHNIISPYRVPLFEALASQSSIDLHVYFCAETHNIRKWVVLESNLYKYEVLSGYTLQKSDLTFHINPCIIAKLIKGKYDVVIISGNPDFTTYATFITSKILNLSTVWWSEGIETSESKLGKIIKPVTKYIVKNVDSVVVPGSLSRDYHLKMGITSKKIFFAPNIVNNRIYIECSLKIKKDKEKLKEELGLKDKKVILYVGQLIERKGVEYLISAYEQLKKKREDISLVIVGDGVLKEKLKAKCDTNYIKDVYFKGWVSEEQKIMFYSISDLFVLPTLRDVWGLVINEAMCCGLPVISTKAAGSSFDMIKNEKNGYVVDSGSVDELCLAINNIISDNRLQQKMAYESLNIIKKQFTLDNMVAGFVSAVQYSCDKNS